MIDKLAFKTNSYYMNYSFPDNDENIITLYDGIVYKSRMSIRKFPLQLGEYEFNIFNIKLANDLNIDILKLLSEYKSDDMIANFIDVINNESSNILKYNKIVLIRYLILNDSFKKKGISEEFIKMLYKNFYDSKSAIIAYCKPIQYQDIYINKDDNFFNYKSIQIKEKNVIKSIPATKYYSLNKLFEKEDKESDEYKIFSVASKCGFSRVNESSFFIFKSNKITFKNMFPSF